MVQRRKFVPRGAVRRNPAAWWLLCAVAIVPPPEIALRARAFEPGEIVRIEIASPGCALEPPAGTFLDQSLSFAPSDRAGAAPSWIGWAVVPLERKPGEAPLQLELRCKDSGAVQSIDRSLEIDPKVFSEQKLEVESKYVNPSKTALARIEREKARLGSTYARRTALPPAPAPFVAPVPGDPTSEFGARRILNGVPKAPHPGIDLRAATGTPVVASGRGVVALAADLYYSGGTVILDHGAGLFTIYAHLSKIEAEEGATVAAGDRLGLSGATGRVTGPHLHWGARLGGAVFDPRGLCDPRLYR